MTQRQCDPRGRKKRSDIYRMLDEAVADLRARLGGLPRPAEAEDVILHR
ncbi:MAG TPA: hypothetical protein VF221_07360 [Chloroflexota bacterium]